MNMPKPLIWNIALTSNKTTIFQEKILKNYFIYNAFLRRMASNHEKQCFSLVWEKSCFVRGNIGSSKYKVIYPGSSLILGSVYAGIIY